MDETKVKRDSSDGQTTAEIDKDQDVKALFDQPLVLEGKRKRKSTELFAFSEKDKSKKAQEYTGGEGCRLGDIPFVEHNISKTKSEQLRVLFKLCYDRIGNKTEIKRCLRDFSGFSDAESVEKKHAALDKMLVPALKVLCELLGIETSGKKIDIANRIVDYLNKPEDLGKVPRKRTRSSTGTGKRKKSRPAEDSDEEKDIDEEDEEKSQENDDVMDTSQTSNGEVKEGVVNTKEESSNEVASTDKNKESSDDVVPETDPTQANKQMDQPVDAPSTQQVPVVPATDDANKEE